MGQFVTSTNIILYFCSSLTCHVQKNLYIKVMSTKNEFRIDHRFGDGGGDCVYAKLSRGGFQ